MSGDVVVFPARRIVAHLGAAGGHRAAVSSTSPCEQPTPGSIEEIGGRPGLAGSLAERLAAARDRWAQLTFYLSSPDSWR
jgi:hypothetical protein